MLILKVEMLLLCCSSAWSAFAEPVWPATDYTWANEPKVASDFCPIRNQTLIHATMRMRNSMECQHYCKYYPRCKFYRYFTVRNSWGGHTSRCLYFSSCDRGVRPVSDGSCSMAKYNTLQVIPDCGNPDRCRQMCEENKNCRYYKYQEVGGGNATTDYNRLCFLVSECFNRRVQRKDCLDSELNMLRMSYFTPTREKCMRECQLNKDCRFYKWDDLDHSPDPNLCSLYRHCSEDEYHSTGLMLSGGRHIGYRVHNSNVEFVQEQHTCGGNVISHSPNDSIVIGRAAACSDYWNETAIICGGYDTNGGSESILDCIGYDFKNGVWDVLVELPDARDESSCVVRGDTLYIFGGVGRNDVLRYDLARGEFAAPVLIWEVTVDEYGLGGSDYSYEMSRSEEGAIVRASAVLVESTGDIFVIGGENHDGESTRLVLRFAPDDTFSVTESLVHARKDHDCTVGNIGGEEMIVCCGGFGTFDNETKGTETVEGIRTAGAGNLTERWRELPSMNFPRSELVVRRINSLIYAIGGVSEENFHYSMERLDCTKTNDPTGMGWVVDRKILTTPSYDQQVVRFPERLCPCPKKPHEYGYEDETIQDYDLYSY